MSLKKLAQRRVSAGTPGESLRQLSPQEVKQVAGAVDYGEIPHWPYPSPRPPNPYPDPHQPYHTVF